MQHKLSRSANIPATASSAIAPVAGPALAAVSPVTSICARCAAVMVAIVHVRYARKNKVALAAAKHAVRRADMITHRAVAKPAAVVAAF